MDDRFLPLQIPHLSQLIALRHLRSVKSLTDYVDTPDVHGYLDCAVQRDFDVFPTCQFYDAGA